MEIYQLKTDNLKVPNDGHTLSAYTTPEIAMLHAIRWVEDKSGSNVVVDADGTLEEYQGLLTKFRKPYKKAGVYYTSHYGNYPCVIYIQPIQVFDN